MPVTPNPVAANSALMLRIDAMGIASRSMLQFTRPSVKAGASFDKLRTRSRKSAWELPLPVEPVDIVWLRDDFRLDDQPALAAASEGPTLFVYVHDETLANGRPPGGAAKWRLAQSLTAMESGLSACGARLDILLGDAEQTILALAAAAKPKRVLWTRRYEGAAIALDARVKATLRERGVEASSFNGRLLREPWELSKADGRPSGSFSAFWRRHQALGAMPAPLPAPKRLMSAPWPADAPARVSVEALAPDPHEAGLVGRTRARRDARAKRERSRR